MSWGDLPERIGRDRVVHEDEQTLLICARYQDVANVVGLLPDVDATILDAPYSERTHKAYREQEELRRRPIDYAPWKPRDVVECVSTLAPLTHGWFVSMTDHVLAPHWERALENMGRYVFAPLACLQPGSRVRQCGDGPAQWSVFAVCARPATSEYAAWGALPGGYVVPPGHGRQRNASTHRIGGKPLWLIRELVSDYSREGDVLLDPVAGYCTLGRAAKDMGRRAILIEENAAVCEQAVRVLRPKMAWQQDMFAETGE